MEPDGLEQLEAALQAPPPDPLQTALSAIETLLGLSSFVLSVVGIALAVLAAVLAVLAVVGWFTIHKAAVKAAEEVAQKRLSDYLEEERFENMLQDKIEEIVRERVAGMLVLAPGERNTNDPHAFPAKPPRPKGEGPK